MSKLIFVAGPPATGKTTFSLALARYLGVPCYNKDTLKEILGRSMPIETREQSRALSSATFELLHHIADISLQADQPVILESNFRPAECDALKSLLNRYHAQALDFVFTGDMPQLYARFTQREQTTARASAHKVHGLDTLEAFTQAVQPLSTFSTGSQTVRVDATDFRHVDTLTLMQTAADFLHAP